MNYIWGRIYRYLRRPHPQKGWKWIKRQYFKPDKTGQSMDKWILTDSVTGNQLKKMAWTPIVRHQQVKYNYSPFDADLKEYFNKRDRNKFDLNNVAYRQKLAKKQKCVCPMCGMSITDFEEGLETHHILPVVKGGTGTYKNLQLVHISCHIEYHRVFPAKGDVPTPSEIAKCHKGIKGKRLAGTL
ncbi:HNH endonuclease [Ruthenibacterium lactatiformans]|uniref:HNH endonuclease n=1 Tax=Ruthenibacterium lactatiformans TaxID=1550024 RepID=UPI00307C5AB0